MSPHYKYGALDSMAVQILYDVLEQVYGVDKDAIRSYSRQSKDQMARAMVARLVRDTFKVSYDTIGDLLGGRNKCNALRLNRMHNKYYALNYHGYRWDFLEIAEEFKGRYYDETSRDSEEGGRESVQSRGGHLREDSLRLPSESQEGRENVDHGAGRKRLERSGVACKPSGISTWKNITTINNGE